MYAELRSPNVHEPKSLAEYAITVQNYKDSKTRLWAGGTYIMSQKDYYPTAKANVEIISLNNIDELKHYIRNDRYAEFGSMVSLHTIQVVASSILPRVLSKTIEKTATRVVRERITIGGALCTPNFRTAIAATLMLLDANVEIRYLKKRMHSKWYHISRIYEKDGSLNIPDKAILTRVRIGISSYDYQYFNTVGSPIHEASSAVSLACIAKTDQSGIISGKLIVHLPSLGFCQSRDIDNSFSSIQLPCDDNRINTFISYIVGNIKEDYADFSQLQEARLKGMLYEMFTQLNTKSLSN